MPPLIRRLLLFLLLTAASSLAKSKFTLPADSQQLLVGLTDGWNSSHVTLTLYQKTRKGWQPLTTPWKGRLGKKGSIWGRGLSPTPSGAPLKKEGDWRSPAGIFRIGGVWGYAPSIPKHPQMAYTRITTRNLWVEDSNSPHYNRHLTLDHEPATTWEKKQQMRQGDHAHSLKMFIAHNALPAPIPGEGSSIFFHIWRGGGSKATAGCTTMSEANLKALIAKLNPQARPLYLLLPQQEYLQKRAEWKLP